MATLNKGDNDIIIIIIIIIIIMIMMMMMIIIIIIIIIIFMVHCIDPEYRHLTGDYYCCYLDPHVTGKVQ